MNKTEIDAATCPTPICLPPRNLSSWKDDPKSARRQRKNQADVLIVDDDSQTVRLMLEILARRGICGTLAEGKKTALDFLYRNHYDLVFMNQATNGQTHPHDLSPVPPKGGEMLGQIRANWPELPVVMLAEFINQQTPAPSDQAHPNSCPALWTDAGARSIVQTVVTALHRGCRDVLLKPLNRNEVENLLDTLLPNHSVSTAASAQRGSQNLYQIVGKSPKLLQTICIAEKMAPTSVPVLIGGESGTGKELISQLIHHKSSRSLSPYIKVNCAALSESLLESELFGHEKGAFTGAYTQRKGRFEMAHGGTILLDEITETPPRFQAKLLRILEQQEFERVGGNENIKVDVRIISTTNKDILQEVQLGRFRKDLYYRLSTARLVLSPLRERPEDLPELAWHFVNLYARQVHRKITKLDPAMMDIFAKYHWPGNIRQLRNVVLTSLILGVGPTLSLADVSWLFDELQPLPQQDSSFVMRDASRARQNTQYEPWPPDFGELSRAAGEPHNTQYDCGLGGVPLEQLERQAILDTLRQTAGNQTKAAKSLGISDRTLRHKIRRYKQQPAACGGLQPSP